MAASFDVDMTQWTALTRDLARATPTIQRHMQRGGREAGFHVEGNAKREAPVKTGNLKNRIGPPSVRQSGVSTTVEVKAHAAYAYIVHEGRGAVVPVRAKALRWTGPTGVVFSMYSGPVAANRFMDRGLKQSEAGIQRAFDMAADAAMRELGL
jgi:hypothetical protein